MSAAVEVQQAVDPERLLVVELGAGAALQSYVAISCRYVPALDATGRRAVALEIVHDPRVPAPKASYFVPSQQLERLLVDPRRVARIRPYAVG